MDQDVINLAKAIRQKESGGRFDAVGDNGSSYGAYQWQQSTWKQHAKDILGDENAQQTPSNQNAVAYGKIKQWKDQGLNPAQIAAKWNSGSEHNWENKIGYNAKVGVEYNVPKYVQDVTNIYHQYKGQGGNYPNVNYNQGVEPVNVEQQKQSLMEQGKPVSVREGRAEPTEVGSVVRSIAKGILTPFLGLASPVKQLLGKGSEVTVNSKYLGDVSDPGTNITKASKGLGQKYREGKISLPGAIVRSAGQPLVETANIASLLPVGGATTGVEKAVAGEVVPKLLSGATAKSAAQNAALGSSMNLGEQLASGEKVKPLQVAGAGLLGAGLGTAAEVGIPKATSYATEKISPLLGRAGIKKAADVAENLNINKASEEARKIVQPQRSEEYILNKIREGNYEPATAFSPEKINLSTYEQSMADEAQNLITTGRLDINANKVAQSRQLETVSRDINRQIQNVINETNQPITPDKIVTELMGKKNDVYALYGDKGILDTNYQDILDKYFSFLKSNDAKGHFKARQELDKWMRTKNPKLFKNYQALKGTNPLFDAYNDIRTVSNDLVANSMPNSPIKDQLMREHYLISLKDKLQSEAAQEAAGGTGSSGVASFLEKKGRGLLSKTGLVER